MDTIAVLESTLDLEDQNGIRTGLKLNNAQRKLIQHIECNHIVMASSSRRTGITTALLLWIGAEMTTNVGRKFYFITHSMNEAQDCENDLIDILFALDPTISESLYNQKLGRVEYNDGYVIFTNRIPKDIKRGVNVVINNAAFVNFETPLATLADLMYPTGQALKEDGKLVVCSCFSPNATKDNDFELCFFNHTIGNALDLAARLQFDWTTNGDKDREWFLKQCELLNWNYHAIQTEINGKPICKLK